MRAFPNWQLIECTATAPRDLRESLLTPRPQVAFVNGNALTKSQKSLGRQIYSEKSILGLKEINYRSNWVTPEQGFSSWVSVSIYNNTNKIQQKEKKKFLFCQIPNKNVFLFLKLHLRLVWFSSAVNAAFLKSRGAWTCSSLCLFAFPPQPNRTWGHFWM